MIKTVNTLMRMYVGALSMFLVPGQSTLFPALFKDLPGRLTSSLKLCTATLLRKFDPFEILDVTPQSTGSQIKRTFGAQI